MEYLVDNLEKAQEIAREIARRLSRGSIVTLSGDLGAGKTFLCREIIKYLCGENVVVSSPTFCILNIYSSTICSIYHYDFYRLKSFSELYELGIEDALNDNICLIEWPEIAADILDRYNKINITIQTIDDTRRIYQITGMPDM